MTPNPDFKHKPLFNVGYFGNDVRWGHSYNGVLGDLLNGVISKD